jgi:hypothetical protein
MSQTMLYKRGTAIKCGPYSLDYLIVGEEEVEENLALGWVKTPAETEESERRKKPGPKPKAAQDGEKKG